MTLSGRKVQLAVALLAAAFAFAARPAPAAAFDPLGPVCSVVGLFSGLLGKGCNVANDVASRVIPAAKDLFTGKVGSAAKALLGQAGSSLRSHAGTIVGLAAIGLWVVGGAKFALHELGSVLGEITTPRLTSNWFSAAYWRMAGIAALLTLPFLFAAAIQALVRSDITLLLRSVLGYLPLALLVVAVAAPITMLLLSASDELSSLVSSASGQADGHAFGLGTAFVGSLTVFSKSLFFACFFGVLMVLGATALWIELVMREAAVYVVVLMLPLAFAALVWPARRAWAIRAVELLVALILSKFVIVAVLSLGGAAMDQIGHSVTTPIVGLVLVMMGAFAPWALLRLVPLSELASATMSSLRGPAQVPVAETARAYELASSVDQWATAATQSMSHTVDQALLPEPGGGGDPGDGEATDRPSGGADPGPEGPGSGGSDALDPDSDFDGSDSGVDSAAMRGAASLDPGGLPVQGFGARAAATSGEGGGTLGSRADAERDHGLPVSGSSGAQSPRLPGMGPMWQAENFSWKPLLLGLEEDWPPKLWPPDGGSEGSGAGAGLLEGEAHMLPAGADALSGPDASAAEPGPTSPSRAPGPSGSAGIDGRPRLALPAPALSREAPQAADPPRPPEPADPARPSDPPVPPERPAGPASLPPPPRHDPEPGR
jgi:hypothetical protein